jgi:predicted GNAT family acetyltransferase
MRNITFINDETGHRYEAALDGTLAAYAEYNLLSDAIMFPHTEVLPENKGKGIGSAIVKHVLDDARTRGLHVIPVCQFIASYIRKHREYVDLVRPDIQRAFKI